LRYGVDMTDMSESKDLSIDRTTDLDLDVDELWALISTEDGWSSWLVDEAKVEITPDSAGTAVEDGVVRDVRIDSVSDGRSVNFSWWDRDDPTSGSFVQLAIVELPNGRSQLNITERFVGATAAMSASMSTSIAVAWDVRLVSLWLLALHSIVMA
jgi:uncharacterized protein YndB with AHSA1/START domain